MRNIPTNYLGIESLSAFNADTIRMVPDSPGVYVFFDERGEAIKIGSAMVSLKDTIEDHWKGYEGPVTCGATSLGYERSKNPLRREAELSARQIAVIGRKPRLNRA